MSLVRRLVPTAALLGLLSGCAMNQPLYNWKGYDGVLYNHYKHPENHDEFVRKLEYIIQQAETEGRKVPPGIYAEYGYALIEGGQPTEAVKAFGKERDLWPESRYFMEKMIANAERMQVRSNRQTVLPAGEEAK
ncbi:MAG: DUF4810 domain-containing protein [Anaeromyxobacter sp.]